jgi:WS/DGAT/MGAT family acyltransferase
VTTYLSPADAVWFLGESEQNPMIVSSLMWFDGPIAAADLIALHEQRVFGRHPVFGDRIVPSRLPWVFPHWEPDPDFDPANHITVSNLPAPGDHDTLQRLCSEERTRGLDRSRPLWAWHQYNGYRGDGSVAHIRFHHSIGDGWALVKLLLTLADSDERDVEVVDDDLHPRLHAATQLLDQMAHGMGAPGDWPALLARNLDRARWAGSLLVPRMPAATSLIGRPSGDKRMVWDPDGLPLDEVKEVGYRHDATVNDVLTAAVAEALHVHLGRTGTPAEQVQMMAPVAIRDPDEPLTRHLGNRIGLLPIMLPTAAMDPRDRLLRIRDETRRLKRSAAPVVSWALLSATSLMTAPGERAFHRFHQMRGTGVLTNVPGPTKPLTLCGAQIVGMLGWGGMTGRLNLSWALCSVNGRVFSGATTDTAITPDPQALLDDYLAAFKHLRDAA